ncbi:MAG: AAA family ATPase, partial [Mogibacterium sp.]|nr:AAA family ATPase [Mogibacterium sp.]
IVAGYTELMKNFVNSNPGLKSRFNKFFEFPDYTVDELKQIFKLQCDKYQYKLTEEAEEAVKKEIERLEATKGENFANAREVRNLFERIITNQASRVSELEDVDEEGLTTITIEDLEDAIADAAEDEDKLKKGIEDIEEAVEIAKKSRPKGAGIIRR